MTRQTSLSASFDFLSGGGEMGALMRAHAWSKTSLGLPSTWPSALKTSLRLLLTSRHPMFIWWGSELLQFYNDAYRETMGPERHPGALGQEGKDCWEEIWPIIGPEIEFVMAGHGATWHEDTLVPITRHGRREDVWWTYGYSPIEDDAGVRAVLVICKDVTVEHLQNEPLKRSYYTLIQAMDQGFCVIEPLFDDTGLAVDYRFLETNQAFQQQSGLQDAIGKTAKALVPGLEQNWIEAFGLVAITGEAIRLEDEAPSMGRWFDVYATRVGSADSRHVALLFTDITERKATQEKLEDADRRKDEFLAMLAHELRNPLAPISAAAELLKIARLDEVQVRKTSEIIDRQVKHMTGLVDDLLDVSRVSRGLVKLDTAPCNLSHIVSDAIEQAAPLIHARRHHLALHLTPVAALIHGDRKRLVQVLANILNNAAKYTHDGGNIHLRTEVDASHIVIEIADTGIGMTPRLITQAFDLFAQAERTSDRASGGLGLGLALVKTIVELHHGTVRCESGGIGAGSTFTVRLPRLLAPVEHDHRHDDAADRHAKQSLRILVVDDNVDAATMLAMLLEAAGHQVLVEHGASRALATARTERPQVCLLDIGLPAMDGNALAQQLRAQKETAGSVLVAVTGYGQEKDRDQSLAAGFDYHLVKPVSSTELFALLAEVSQI